MIALAKYTTPAFVAIITLAVSIIPTIAMAALPRPTLRFVAAEQYWVGRQAWMRYELSVDNYADFEQRMFDDVADRHACYASRTGAQVRLYDLSHPGQPIHVFCPRNRQALGAIRYALPKNKAYVGWVMVTITDRRTNESRSSDWIKTNVGRPSPTDGGGRRPVTPY